MGDLGKLIAAKGFKKMPKVQEIANLVTLFAKQRMEESFILCATLVGRYCSAWAEFPKVFLQICVCLHRPTDRSSVHFFSMTSAIFEEDNSLSLFHSFLYFLAKLLFVQKWEGKKVFIWRLVDHLHFRYSTFFSKNIHLIGAWRILPKQQNNTFQLTLTAHLGI